VAWSLARTIPSLLVPPSSIVRTTERTFVDRVRDGVVEQVPVQLGITADERVEVFGALDAGDVIVKRGREELATGSRVQTVAAVSKK